MCSSSASRREAALSNQVERRPSITDIPFDNNERRRGLNFDEVGEEDDKRLLSQIMSIARVGDGLLTPTHMRL